MITANVVQRVFNVLHNQATGTCFTIDVNGKQYVISAQHLFENVKDVVQIQIFHEDQWKLLTLRLVGHCPYPIDISVLSADFQLSPTLPLEPTLDGIVYGQDVYFLGFPYQMHGNVGVVIRNFPLPFVKKAILSCLTYANSGIQTIYLDGHNNPGFSGGPVVYQKPNSHDFKVAGVISAYRFSEEPIYDSNGPIPLVYRYNTGIIICYSIQHAVDVIKNNPIGFELTR